VEDRRKRAGDYGETAADGYLAAKGYEILARKYKAYGGEIDIVARYVDARYGEYIVFVEVKYRKSLAYGRPADAVSQNKQRALIKAARGYLARFGRGDEYCRFDVLEIFGKEQLHINHIENAFEEK